MGLGLKRAGTRSDSEGEGNSGMQSPETSNGMSELFFLFYTWIKVFSSFLEINSCWYAYYQAIVIELLESV